MKIKGLKKKFLLASLSFIMMGAALFFVFQKPAFAQNVDTGLDYVEPTGLSKTDPRIIVVNIIRIFLGFLGLIALILIIYAGFIWMTAGGEADKIERAKAILKNALIGLLIILSSYAVVAFILSKLNGNDAGTKTAIEPGTNTPSYFGSLGNNIIESHYPARNQKDVPRNTKVVVTFREEMSLASIIKDLAPCPGGEGQCGNINYDNLKLYKSEASSYCKQEGAKDDTTGSCVTDVSVQTIDNKTFTFRPKQYLGNPNGNVGYAVYLGTGIKKKDGTGAFGMGGNYEWNFEVSNKLDLVPPQVKSIFPFPDNSADNYETPDAIAAEWQVNIKILPSKGQSGSFEISPGGGSSAGVEVKGTYGGEEDAIFNIVIKDEENAEISINGGAALAKSINDNAISLGYGLTLALKDNFAAGNSWHINAHTQKAADYIKIDNKKYIFGDNIEMSTDLSQVANNAKIAIEADELSPVSATVAGTVIKLKAKSVGANGNGVAIISSTNKMEVSQTVQGRDKNNKAELRDLTDQPINAIVQINFNEAIDPLMAVKYISVKNSSGEKIGGDWIISNQYKTVEFKTSNKCGTNSCGEDIYCLPEFSNISIFSLAAKLKACSADSDCPDPAFSCNSGVCKNNDGKNYPLAEYNTGIVDMSDNSLDGNGNSFAEGSQVQSGKNPYNANVNKDGITQENPGDDYLWSFWTSDKLDLTAPEILSRTPNHNATDIPLDTPLTAQFDKLMMSGSLKTGSVTIGEDTHSLINLQANTSNQLGYWIEKEDKDVSPKDSYPDQTETRIMHDRFEGENNYSGDIGSGVKDIYQNCYNPSAGPCAANPNKQCDNCKVGGNCDHVIE